MAKVENVAYTPSQRVFFGREVVWMKKIRGFGRSTRRAERHAEPAAIKRRRR
jgi:hypothetical protein